MKRKHLKSRAGDKLLPAFALALSLSPQLLHGATGDLTTNAATVRADNIESISSNNVSGVTGSEGVPKNSITNSTFVKADNADLVPANNGVANGTLSDTGTDTDGDGIPDAVDLDSDNDGIPNSVENATALNGGDTDGDGIPDYLDLDSDNDGIPDAVEAGHANLPLDMFGRIIGPVGTDGIPDGVQPVGAPNGGAINYTIRDTDGDGHPDFQDLDSDNDGINDVRESNGTDVDGDGLADGTPDQNGVPSSVPAGGAVPPDTDGDGKPDYRDLDSDNDGINDVTENGGSDPDNNGIVGYGQIPTDTDGDGIPNAADGAPATFGDLGDAMPRNSDNDPIPNYRDLDSDNDGTADVIEGGNGSKDLDHNGTISPSESADDDGDGIPTSVDQSTLFGDAGNTPPPDTDGDGFPDYIDPDRNNDGIPDLVADGHDPALDDNGDGMIDNPIDPDHDGIPNNGGNDATPGGFGGATPPGPLRDTDGDGIPDIYDLDADNDGIPNSVEKANAINGGDTDGDGIPDYLDLDSDNDGILDLVEAGHAGLDANKDGRVDGPVGTDGIPDIVQPAGGANGGKINYIPRDTDGDGHPDYVDLDSDNDGINDVRESNGTDANGDGYADGTPVNSDGIRSSVPAGGAVPPDTDGDGKPDYRDLDSDNDGINDVVENGGPDPDGNGIVGTGPIPADFDGDGIPDVVDGSPATAGDALDPALLNSDNDTVPNFRDLDSDNDGTADVVEGGNGAFDTDHNGTISPTESPDSDGDGIPNTVDSSPYFGDTGGALPLDTDGDGKPDFIDLDRNNDGIPDLIADGHPASLDPNKDGMIDSPVDPDNDGIPNNGGNDTDPTHFGGATPPTTLKDSDGDGIPDIYDLDADNDGIPNSVENATALNGGDTDGDGIPDYLDLDSDNDGILDIVEAGHAGVDANKDGRVDGLVGADGIPDSVQPAGAPDGGNINYTPRDTDGDGHPDFQDLDSDNDGINDVRESNGTDANGDGYADGGVNGSGITSSVPAGGAVPPDTDGDGKPDYRDLDSDNDGIPDVIENGGSDPDNNGIVGYGQVPTDSDGDGIPNAADGAVNNVGDQGDPTPLNSDNDTIPNYRDLDSDNDGTADVIEGGNGLKDPDHNGTITPSESPDSDGDGIPDSVDYSPLYGDADSPTVPDTDGDGKPDFIDTDRDNDGTPDLIEDGSNPALDPNKDGMIDNPVDPDSDGVPNNLGNDTDPTHFGGATPPKDSDGDGIPDNIDKDDDNDGIPDTVEIANAINGGDTDGDGIPDYLDLDSDGDGIPDAIEAGHVKLPLDSNGRIIGPVGTDGIPDGVQPAGGANGGTVNYTVRDTDSDGRPDYLDLDSDNDSISDVLESGNTGVVDADHDGIADGTPNPLTGTVPGTSIADPKDTDGDGTPDYRDVDSNNDGVKDIVTNGYGDLDGDGNGRIDNTTDPDGDGIPNNLDTKDTVFGGFPTTGCTAWSLENAADTDQDVFPRDQEYALGGNPALGDHIVVGTPNRRQGLTVTKNATGGVDVSFVRPAGRYDVTYTLYANADLSSTWSPIGILPTTKSNGDGTDTLTWVNAQGLAPLTRDLGFVRLQVKTPCDPAGSFTLVQGWSREDIVGKIQTYGINFPSFPVFTGKVDSAAGSTITTVTSGNGQNLGAYIAAGSKYYIEFTDGAAEGQRIDVTGGGSNTFTLDLASPNNTTATLPAGAAGSHFVIRKHRTLGEIFVNNEWNASNTVGSADQVQFFNGTGYDNYLNYPNGTWVKQGAGFANQNSKVIPAGEAVLVVHADPNDTNTLLQIGEVRYNDFIRPVKSTQTGMNFVALGFPLDESPGSLLMTSANGFQASTTVGSATQVLNWSGDTVVNAAGFSNNFQRDPGTYRTQGSLGTVTTNSLLFKHDRGAFVYVPLNKTDWTHFMKWNPAPWVQP